MGQSILNLGDVSKVIGTAYRTEGFESVLLDNSNSNSPGKATAV